MRGPAWWSARPSSCCAPRSGPGITTGELDAIAEDNIRSHGGDPVVPGLPTPFPGSICASVNDEVVHGIPGDAVLAEGDVDLDRLRRDRRRLARRRRDHRRGGRRSPDEVHRADAGHRGGHVARASRPRASAAGSPTSPTPWRPTSAAHGRLRHPRGLHRPRHRHRRCTSRPTSPTSAAPAAGPKLVRGPGAGRGADDHARQQGDRRRSRTTGRS